MSSRRLPTGTVSPPSREERVRPRSGESATRASPAADADADELARENRRLARENRRLRERLDEERTRRQAVIDRYEGLVDGGDPGPDTDTGTGAVASDPSAPSGATVAPERSALARLARFLGLR